MTNAKNLPEKVNSHEPARQQSRMIQLPPRYGKYAISETDTDVSIVRVSDANQALLERKRIAFGRKMGIATAVAGIAEQATFFMPGTPLEKLAIAGPTAAIVLNYTLVQPFRSLTLQRRQYAAVTAELSSERAIKLPDKFFGVHLGAAALEAEVTYQSEDELVTEPVGKLLKSVGLQAPGLRFETTDHSDGIKGEVSPGRLMKQALKLIDEPQREGFIGSVFGDDHVRQMGEAADALKPIGLTATTPASLRPSFEHHATQLLTSSLAVYGVLRAQVGVQVAEQARDFYAQQDGSMAIIDDALRLERPTANEVSWSEIINYRQHFAS